MGVVDWLIVIIPTLFVLGIGIYSRRYVRSVADFLSAGRVAGRYVIATADVANALAVVTLVAYVEVQYKTGFAVSFWNNISLPVATIMGLYGYCVYRLRETRAMSIGQFLEIRYNRALRVFASLLRSISEVMANMIMPAIAARFFIYYLDLPQTVNLFGIELSTFVIVVMICLLFAVTLIYFGGTVSLMISDTIQGLFLFPLMLIFIIFLLYKFNWNTEMIPVMANRASGESFLNPFDISNLRDFNLVMVIVTLMINVLHRASWLGGGTGSAARTPHEQKMASMLGSWRAALNMLFYVLIAITMIVLLNHPDFSPEAKEIRIDLSREIATELVAPENRDDFIRRIAAVPADEWSLRQEEPLSQFHNPDLPTLNAAHEAFKIYEGESAGNARFQEYRTLFHQLMMAIGMRNLLPPVLTGLFMLLLVFAMISTDTTRIFSATQTIAQDVVLPFCPDGLPPRKHIFLLRTIAIVIALIFLCGSFYMAQLDYINMFVSLMTLMWLGGCGPIMIFGLYSRLGNAAGAFASLISGMALALFFIFVQRNWADTVYPWLAGNGWDQSIGYFIETVSSPLNPFVVWEMNPVKFPINAYEINLLTMIITMIIFCTVSFVTQRKPFNLDRMLHRGIYDIDGTGRKPERHTLKNLFSRLIGITPEYSRGDRCIAWGLFIYSFIYQFLFAFIAVVVWNIFSPWPIEWWSGYFFITTLLVPAVLTFISMFWFGIGSVIDIIRLFRDLEHRIVDPLDNGQVEGNISLADKAGFARIAAEHDDPAENDS